MKRDHAIFGESRLYRQAEEGSQKIAHSISQQSQPFEVGIRAISSKDRISVSSIEDGMQWVSSAERHVFRICQQVSPHIAIPVLMQLITEYYYGSHNREPVWLGTALKLALAIIAGNVYYHRSVHLKSLKKVEEAILLSAFLDQIKILTSAYGTFAKDDDFVELMGDRVEASEHMQHILDQYLASYLERGKTLRTVSDSVKAIWQQPMQALAAIGNVLEGASPKDQSPFEGTLFSRLTDNEPQEFWAGIWTRLNMAIHIMRIRSAVTRFC